MTKVAHGVAVVDGVKMVHDVGTWYQGGAW
jgi:hypothetical protein